MFNKIFSSKTCCVLNPVFVDPSNKIVLNGWYIFKSENDAQNLNQNLLQFPYAKKSYILKNKDYFSNVIFSFYCP